MNPTIYDVARLANVSISTVSRVVNNPESVRPEKRKRVLQVIEELGYEPNPFASGLRDKRTMTIVAAIPDISNPFFSQLFRGIEDAAKANRNSVIICNTDRKIESFIEYMRYFKKKKVDGLVFASDPVTPLHLETFRELNVPVVLAATRSQEQDIPFVKIDDYKASYDAAQFLLKNGHSQVGFISGPTTDPIAGTPRYEGFVDGMQATGLTLEALHKRIVFGDFSFDSGYEMTAKLYGQFPELTAVFAASDLMALGAMSFLQRHGLAVPADVSVMGFDNLPLAPMLTPALTSVSQPIYSIGQKSAALLMQWIETTEPPTLENHLEHEIVVRDTVGKREPCHTQP